METQTLLYIILAGIVALLLALFQYRYKTKHKSKLNLIFTFLRFITFFSIFLLLINPKFEKVSYFNEKPNLVVALDNSESIKFLNQNENASGLIETFQNDSRIKDKFNLDVYTFGKNIHTKDSISYSKKQTNLSSIFNNLSQVYKDSNAPMLLISDGNQTFGSDYEFTSAKYKHPIFPVILGDTITYSDLKIQQLNVNKYAYLKNKFPVEVITVYNGNQPINTQFVVTSGKTTVFKRPISFSKENSSQILSFTLPANRVGVRSYKAQIIPLGSEKNKTNNSKEFAIEVIDQKTTIAIISDIIHPDLGALKKAIESNEQRSVSILKPNEYLLKPNDFQLVILYQPNQKFKPVFDEIKKVGTNKFVITGIQTQWTSLNNFQEKYKQTITNQTEDFQATLNTNYSNFIINDVDFSSFPPLKSEFGTATFNTVNDIILYKTINGITTEEPLLVTLDNGTKREAILFGENIWKWRAQSYLNKKAFNQFDDFIGKLVQYLASTKRKNRLNLDYESFYDGSTDVKISAQFFNKNYEFDSKAFLNITIKNNETDQITTQPFILKNNFYEVDLSSFQAGEYTFTVLANNGEAKRSGTIKILDYNVEQQFLNANVTKLQQVATNSKATSYFISNTSTLIDDLVSDSRFETVQKSNKNVVPLIDFKYLLALIALSLVIEWFLRKYNGLI
jgi:hypothetical protein